jgi:gamma-glutamyltranspeptidase / glutathione hydrolase
VDLEDRIPLAVRDGLTARGHKINLHGAYSAVMGGGQAVQRDISTGVNYGASDPRKDGEAIPEPSPQR